MCMLKQLMSEIKIGIKLYTAGMTCVFAATAAPQLNCECNVATGERKQRERPSKIDVIIFLFEFTCARIMYHLAYYQIGNGVCGTSQLSDGIRRAREALMREWRGKRGYSNQSLIACDSCERVQH